MQIINCIGSEKKINANAAILSIRGLKYVLYIYGESNSKAKADVLYEVIVSIR